MSFLLDTNVVSELRKRSGVVDAAVLAWSQRQQPHDLYISAVTVLEIELGILRVERRDSSQGRLLRRWLDDGVLPGFADRVLPVDADVARRAARLHVPDPRPERNAYIAATALMQGSTVVTRNVGDFEGTGAVTLDPWTSEVGL